MIARPRRSHATRPSRAARPRTVIAVAGVVLVSVLIAGCGIPTSATPKAIAKSALPEHLLHPTTSSTTPSSAPSVDETIFLVAGQNVTPVLREVPLPANLSQIITAVLYGPTAAESASGLQSFVVSQSNRVSATTTNGIATVDFSTNPFQVVGQSQILGVAQVVFTATEQPGVLGVLFQIAGQPIDVQTSPGENLVPGPVTRADYAPQAPVTTTPATP